jgi:8-oxo-dGTP pyrophosphatase MutT (NUDIX family)
VASKAKPTLAVVRQRLAVARPPRDARARLLANVEGPLSPGLAELLERPARPASVLLALLERPNGLTVLLTERAAHLKDHAGQISLPGGRIAVGESATAAALREAEEEVGLGAARVTLLGALDVLLTGTGFSITPVVGYVAEPFSPAPDPQEVAQAFEVPLEFLLAPGSIRVGLLERLGSRLRTYEFDYGGHRVWGATAAILSNFKEIVK